MFVRFQIFAFTEQYYDNFIISLAGCKVETLEVSLDSYAGTLCGLCSKTPKLTENMNVFHRLKATSIPVHTSGLIYLHNVQDKLYL